MYLHAERLLAKAGGSNCKPRGIPTLATKRSGVERAERSGGLHKRRRGPRRVFSTRWGDKRGRLGSGLQARGAELPLAAFAVAFVLRGGALRVGGPPR